LPPVTDPNVIVGMDTSDDAAVYKLTDELALILTVDYFTPIVDDPYQFGSIAAANAFSDVYAMGGKPFIALNIAGFPPDKLPMSYLVEILRGGANKAAEAGVSIVGGHTIDDPEPKYGLCVAGLIHPQEVIRNGGARPGDELVLTKPLGSGIITTGIKRGKVDKWLVEKVVEVMSTLNKAASEAMISVGVNACTDVTGFGLLGHLNEMVLSSGVGAVLYADRVPLLPQVRDLAAQGVVPGGTRRNLSAVSDAVMWAPEITEDEKLILADAQTSGGLIIAVPRDKTSRLVSELGNRGVKDAAVIGEIVKESTARIYVRAH